MDRIILLKNDAISASITKSNPNEPSPKNCGSIFIEAEADLYDINNYIMTDSEIIHDSGTFYGEYFGNILDVGDLGDINDVYLLNEESIENIHFGFDPFYESSPNTPNSTATNQGKLTLLNVVKAGRGNTSLIPPYRFQYNEAYTSYNNELKDSWGYSSTNPAAWSLSKIKTPPGGEILIDYEEDSYAREAAITNFIFSNNKFEMKFLGTQAGAKQVVFRNHGDNTPAQDISFYDYFQVDEESEINIKFIQDPTGGSDERVADVNKICRVAAVTQTTVTFDLPINSHSLERTEIICNATNWAYYHDYDIVVSESSGWLREHQPDFCDEVGNGSRWRW